jgi:hypothetical protein
MPPRINRFFLTPLIAICMPFIQSNTTGGIKEVEKGDKKLKSKNLFRFFDHWFFDD